MPNYLLRIDVSTTATKALLIDQNGNVVAVAATEYPFETPHPLWWEQDAALFWNGPVQNLRAVLEKSRIAPAHIAAVRLTGQIHGLTLLDTHGDLLRPCILWTYQRTAAQCAAITQRVGPARVQQLIGNPVPTGLTTPMLLWVRGNEPNLYRRVADLLLPKDYTRYKLTGGFFSDMSGSFGTSFQGRRKYACQ